ncbi:MAG: hypothetical protein HKN16_04400 [Saprospiraceae bacterium]|nr:hypothetical protein [Saprospiraceae bacterium]
MVLNLLFNVIRDVIVKVAKKNNDDPEVETADERVFKKIEEKAQETVNETESEGRSRGDLYERLRDRMNEVQKENEKDPDVATADTSVFDDFLKEIERIKAQQSGTEIPPAPSGHQIPPAQGIPPVYESTPGPVSDQPEILDPKEAAIGSTRMTNSFGGSLALRMAPDMGAGTNQLRVPDQSVVKILQISDRKIILDGKESNWVLIEFNGQQGWLLDSYINF